MAPPAYFQVPAKQSENDEDDRDVVVKFGKRRIRFDERYFRGNILCSPECTYRTPDADSDGDVLSVRLIQ